MVSTPLMSWLTPNMSMESVDTQSSSARSENNRLTTAVNNNNDSNVKSDLEKSLYEKREVVAEWRVPIKGKVFKIEFEHGTASGKRVLWVDEKEIFRREWMFKLVGEDSFKLEDTRCIVRVDPAPGFKYKYLLFVGGKSYEQFTERQAKALKSWEITVNEKLYRIVLEKDTLNIWLNGKMRDETGEFVDGGADTELIEDGIKFIIRSRSSGNKRMGIVHSVTCNGAPVPEVKIDN